MPLPNEFFHRGDSTPDATSARTAYFVLSWLHMAWQTLPYFSNAAPAPALGLSFVFHLAAWLGYSALYTAFALLPALAIPQRLRRGYALAAIAGSTMGLLIVRIDRTVFDLYNFHLNGFVWNLVMTPGGIDSLGGGSDSYFAMGSLAAGTVAVQMILWFTARPLSAVFGHRNRRAAAFIGIALLLVAELGYGVGDLRNDGAILDTADNYPLFLRVRFRSAATRLGFAPATRETSNAVLKVDASRLRYPLHPMRYDATTRPLNIVWLVAESLRWDQLTPDIMPNTWALAQRGQHFLHHYSSGNGTREGLFGMFYGLYGSYWDNFLHAGRGPLLIERMQQLNYRMQLRTSARFTYPEFDKTLFVGVPPALLHEEKSNEPPWQRDRDNTSALLDDIATWMTPARQTEAAPFFSFLFFESTHARYSFPDESIVRRPYLENIDYTDMSREKLARYAGQLRNRYSNAAHWIDVQIGRIVDALEQRQLLDSTVVIITGDHGEEFMEKGFWGHNSSFVEEQTHTPLVVSMPGMTPRKIERTTSHMDIAVTLMQMLGAGNEVGDYALGHNLFEINPAPGEDKTLRQFIVVSDWHSIGIKADDFKYRIPYASRGVENFRPTRGDDSPLARRDSERAMIAQHQPMILEAARNITRFAR